MPSTTAYDTGKEKNYLEQITKGSQQQKISRKEWCQQFKYTAKSQEA
jgi:hypothetical protein